MVARFVVVFVVVALSLVVGGCVVFVYGGSDARVVSVGDFRRAAR